MSVTNDFLILISRSLYILYRCRVLVIYTTEGVVFGVISCVETTIFTPSAKHDGGLCFAASTFGWGSVRIACSISTTISDIIGKKAASVFPDAVDDERRRLFSVSKIALAASS